ncbi:MAG: putative 3 beta-hydroxysteroid dehydrogenase/Delta 5--_4-isomerase [Prokaryotic dsDNA virus sp.]|nr:MAG: putative 3 beta-hydroxysteroid dehydrogenase/Delta 5-->4-isomerase [Prokaryotic dsDNA virus sp.]|tara:strand:- start:2452 stop:3348 length:897 start_codon:yes stop_codon:yes gene_type:complete
MKFLVTGGRGFIGSHFVEEALEQGHEVIDIDKMTYAASRQLPWDNNPNYRLEVADISEITHLPPCDVIVNFAAESHVDNSIRETDPFVKSNILGVHNLLELVRGKMSYNRPLFFHISTDEVYGDRLEGSFVESDKLTPSNPYSATKAAAEMLIFSYARTYKIDYVISRSANNYGERQYEEKLIPKCISSILSGKKIPIHGDGTYIRDWTYVKDNVSGLFCILNAGKDAWNQVYNVSAENHMKNLEVVDEILSWHSKGRECIEFVENRWGQDLRYSISSQKLRNLGWSPKYAKGIYKWQ